MNKMKNRIKIVAMFCLFMMGGGLMAQNNAVDRYYEQYREDDRFTRISVSSKMFDLFTNFDREDPAEQEVVETISKLKGLKMLVGNDIDGAEAMYKDVVKRPLQEMEELMTVEEKGSKLNFFISEKDGMISELLLVSFGDRQVMMMSLVGDIDLKQISRLSKKMDLEGFEHLENIGN